MEEASEHEQLHCPERPPHVAQHRSLPLSAGPPPPYRYGEMEQAPTRYPVAAATPHPNAVLRFRVVALMGPNDQGSSVHQQDIPALKTLELFEAPPDVVAALEGGASAPLTTRQVGLRCSYCASSKPDENNTIFPTTMASVASEVRRITENHLQKCESIPSEVREACVEAVKTSTDSKPGEKDPREMDLLDYCVGFCQHMGIVNKQPHKSGIAFADIMEGSPSPFTPAETPGTIRGPPSGPIYSNGDRLAFSAPRDSRFGYPAMVRPGAPFMTGQVLGPGDAIAPTPLQRRRDRPNASNDRGPYPASADRPDAAPTPAGYPTPFQGQPGRKDGQDFQIPAQPNFEGKGQTPLSSQQPEEPSPPQGYAPHFDLPLNFPFYQETDRTWHCRFCAHIHPSYRDPQAIWQATGGAPPLGSFIDSHLSMCRGYHHSAMPPPMYQGAPPPPYGAPWMAGSYPPPPGWDGHSPPGRGGHYPPSAQGSLPQDHQFNYLSGAQDGYEIHRKPGPFRDTKRNMSVPHLTVERGSQEQPAANARRSVNYLAERESEYSARNPTSQKDCLVLEEDQALLTDYFYHLMLQLRLCRFSEADRKTRGGKREKIKLGYGGLQCIHCADIPNSRKFFWSNVDRLANSFAEIPGHVLKCRRCPEATKAALHNLKRCHPEQMARLPRGSQKVFFRRMWRRLHDDDDAIGAAMVAQEDQENADKSNKEFSSKSGFPSKATRALKSDEESDSDDSVSHLSAAESAKILAEYSQKPARASESTRVMMSIPSDKEWISDMDCYIRKQLEFFCATAEDVALAESDRKFPITIGQVGIRCLHCSLACKGDDGCCGTAVSYPFQINGIYEAVREFQRLHLESCKHTPAAIKEKIAASKGASSLSSVLRKYYSLAAKAVGLYDSRDGVRAGGECVPIGNQLQGVREDSSLSPRADKSKDGSNTSPKRQESPNGAQDEPVSKKTKPDGGEAVDASPAAPNDNGEKVDEAGTTTAGATVEV